MLFLVAGLKQFGTVRGIATAIPLYRRCGVHQGEIMCSVITGSTTTLPVERDGKVIGIASWTEGFIPGCKPRKALTENDVLAFAVFLERRGLQDQADELLERYLQGYRMYP